MSHVRAEVLRVSRSRSGWREGNPKPNQRPYINSLKSTFEGSTNIAEKPQRQEAPKTTDSATKPQRLVGSKVSTIANMFQSMSPAKEEVFYARPGLTKPESPRTEHSKKPITSTIQSPERPKLDRKSSSETLSKDSQGTGGGSVHLNRTESHLARFNNARAMFERLEEQSIRSKSVYSPNSMKRSGSVSPNRSSPSRTTFSPTMFSRSPSPSETQSVGSSPKRDSPLSPREKSQSADSILGERNRENTATFFPSSHLNGRRHNLDLDLSCSGAGEAIVSPGPLSPHLASYLAEDLLSNGSSVLPKCVLVEEKLIVEYETKSKVKPFPISPKPIDVNNKGTTKTRKRDEESDSPSPSPPCSPPTRSTSSRSVGTSPSSVTLSKTMGDVYSGNSVQHGKTTRHIPNVEKERIGSMSPLDCDETIDERPMLISAVEKKSLSLDTSVVSGPKISSVGSRLRKTSDGNIIPNGRSSSVLDSSSVALTPSLPKCQTTAAFNDKVPGATLEVETAVVADGHGTLRLCSPKSPDNHRVLPLEEQSVVVEAKNEQLLREVQGSLNRDLESGSQILVLSSTVSSGDVLSEPVHITLNGTVRTDDDDDDVEIDVEDFGFDSEGVQPDIISSESARDVLCEDVDTRTSEQLIDTQDLQLANGQRSLLPNRCNIDSEVITSPSSKQTTPTKEVDLSGGSYSENDGIGVSTKGTSPLSPKWDGDNEIRKELKVIIPPSPINGDFNHKEIDDDGDKAGEEQVFNERSEADEPEVMTPEEADRLLSRDRRRSPDIISDEEASEAKMLLRTNEETYPEGEESTSGCETHEILSESRTVESVTTGDDYEEDYNDCPEEEVETEYNGMLEEEEEGVHILEDGHFWVEVPGLPESDDEEVIETFSAMITPKKRERVKFSTKPIRVYSTFSVMDYDRRNDDVDPVSASAEYELEKRVEKMDVFPVDLMKGPEGLGLSIIGMGVGADAGLEKLGIFIKTITEGGAAHKDGRIDVNDQIIEVDGKSLVGVTQAYAASVLRNTSGLVSFLVGREKDGENSEVAQLISQSLQADREREDRRRAYEQELQQQQQRQQSEGEIRGEGGGYPGLTLPIPSLAVHPPVHTAPKIMVQEDSTPEEGDDGPTCEVFDLEESSESPSPESDVAALRIKLKEAQYKNAVAGAEINKSKVKVAMLETLQSEREEYEKRIQMLTARLVEVDRLLESTKKEVMSYQDMLEESQGQYIILEKKYYKAKKLIKECQQREQDLVQREEFHIQQLQEKDQEYNALVKSLKDRVIQLEQDLMETQRAAGLPVKLPYDNTSIKQLQLTPQQLRKPQVIDQKKRGSKIQEADASDSELSDGDFTKYDISPDSDDNENKTSTVERKPPSKDDLFEKAVPQHELLDSTAAKTKAELASKGSLANRQPPSLKKAGSTGSSGDGVPFDLKDVDSSTSLGSSREDLDEYIDPQDKTSTSASMSSDSSPVVTPLPSLDGSSMSPQKGAFVDFSQGSDGVKMQSRVNSSSAATISAQLWKMSSSIGSAVPSGRGSPVRIDDRFAEEMRIILERKNVEAKRHATDDEFVNEKSTTHIRITTEVQGNMTPSPGSTVSSQSSDSNTTGGSEAATMASAVTHMSNASRLPSSKRESSSGCVRLCPQSEPGPRGPPLSCCCLPSTAQAADSSSLDRVGFSDEQESAVANFSVKRPSSLIGDQSSGGFGVVSSNTGALPERRSNQWHSCSVMEWSSSQVGQWLLALSMEQYISMFMENNIGGHELLNMDGTKLKTMGMVNSNDRSILKKKLKDLKVLVEKERKAVEKEMRAREKLQKKAERQAEKGKKK